MSDLLPGTWPACYWWLSFADAKRPKGEQFLGAVIVRAPDVPRAVARAWELGINPGGEVAFHSIPSAIAVRIPNRFVHVLMDRATAETVDEHLLPGEGPLS